MAEITGLEDKYEVRRELLHILAAKLEERTKNALEGLPHIDRITFRVKDTASFLKKAANPKYEYPLVQLEDQIAGRVITFFRDDLNVVKKQLTLWFGAVEHETKEPAEASEFGYESDHFVFVIAEHLKPEGWNDLADMPQTFEFQLRTLFMHAWAEPQHDIGYKGDLDGEAQKELAWIAASAWGADRTMNELARRLSAPESIFANGQQSNLP